MTNETLLSPASEPSLEGGGAIAEPERSGEDVLLTLLATGASLVDAAPTLVASFGIEEALRILGTQLRVRPFDTARAVAEAMRGIIDPNDVWAPRFAARKAKGIEDLMLEPWHYNWVPEDRRPERFAPYLNGIGVNAVCVGMAAMGLPNINSMAIGRFALRSGYPEWLVDGMEDGDNFCNNSLKLKGKAKRLSNLGWTLACELDLTDCKKLENLPSWLAVEKCLVLTGCEALKSLPAELTVGSHIFLDGCTAWDGIVPDSAQVGGRIFLHKPTFDVGDYQAAPGDGLTLAEWRIAKAG